MGLVPDGAWVSRPPVLGMVALFGACPLVSQNHGPGIPTMTLVRPPAPCVLAVRRETKSCSPFSTMTLCEQWWHPIPFRAVFHLLVLDYASCSGVRAFLTHHDLKHLCRAPPMFPPCVLARSGVSTTPPQLWPAARLTMPVKIQKLRVVQLGTAGTCGTD